MSYEVVVECSSVMNEMVSDDEGKYCSKFYFCVII